MPRALELYADARRLASWHAQAARGEEFTYAICDGLDPAHPTIQLVRGWIDDGSATSVQGGRPGERVYTLQRTVPPAAGAPERAPMPPIIDGTGEGELFALLEECARGGLPCPSNAALAKHLGLTRHQVRHRIAFLAGSGFIAVTNQGGPFDGRVVTIRATGARTAAPDAATISRKTA